MRLIKWTIISIILVVFLGCSDRTIHPKAEIKLFEDLFSRLNKNGIQQVNCENVLVYKYLAKLDTNYHVDTIKIGRREIPKFDIEMGKHKVYLIDDFLNADRNKYKNISPSCGIIISEINYLSKDHLYFIVNFFSHSMSSSIYRVDYKLIDNQPEFVSYKFIIGT